MDIKAIAEQTLRAVAEEAIREVIAHNAGYGVRSEIKDAIQVKAKEILNEPEMQQLIRDALVHWIKHEQ